MVQVETKPVTSIDMRCTMWEYRVVQVAPKDYGICEVYYNGDTIDSIIAHIFPDGANVDDLKADVENMLKAFDKPCIPYEEAKELIEKE